MGTAYLKETYEIDYDSSNGTIEKVCVHVDDCPFGLPLDMRTKEYDQLEKSFQDAVFRDMEASEANKQDEHYDRASNE